MGVKDAFKAAAAKRFSRIPADLPDDFEGRDAIFVRKLSAAERDEWEAGRVRSASDSRGRMTTTFDLKNARAKLLVLAICDAEGNRLFADSDAAELGNLLPGDLADRLAEQAVQFNGLMKGEDLAKNAQPGGGGSPSA